MSFTNILTSINPFPSCPFETTDKIANLIQAYSGPRKEKIELVYSSDGSTCLGLAAIYENLSNLYRTLSWPPGIKKIGVLTDVNGGLGDVAAAAKVISVMKKIQKDLTFFWLLSRKDFDLCPLQFVGPDVSNIKWSQCSPLPKYGSFFDLKIIGPVVDYDGDGNKCFFFHENAKKSFVTNAYLSSFRSATPTFKEWFGILFGQKRDVDRGISMGLEKGTGIFLDPSRVRASLSKGDCCPTYLSNLSDVELLKDITEALGQELPDYEDCSLNFGYAHWPRSWERFILMFAMHETKKSRVVIVMNQKGERGAFTTSQFCERIFTKENLLRLKKLGFGTVIVKGSEEKPFFLQKGETRTLSIIVRPRFIVNDMRNLQLASERLFATGDNSAAESFASRCKLYLYEDLADGCKWRFLQQQIDLAQTLFPALGRLLALGAMVDPLTQKEWEETQAILLNPYLSEATMNLCRTITKRYSFAEKLEGFLKRKAWHQCIPQLIDIEAEGMNASFQKDVVSFLQNPKSLPTTINIGFSRVVHRVEQEVSQYLRKT